MALMPRAFEDVYI